MRVWVDGGVVRSSLAGAAVALAVAVVAGCGGSTDEPTAGSAEPDGATTVTSSPTAASTESPAPVPAAEAVRPQGFTTVMIEVTDAAGDVCEVCVWLADSAEERGRGLMGVTDLGDAAGMLFSFDAVAEHRFYMLNTPTPLSIAWFGADGEFVSSTDMAPCLDPPDGGCPLYPPGGPAASALEVLAGGLDELGVGEGSVLRVVADSEADTCPSL